MEFRTKITFGKAPFKIDYNSNLMLLGSCFAKNMSQKLKNSNIETNVNPFGVLYNPASVAQALHLILDKKIFDKHDLFQHQGCYHSFFHHSSFSNITEESCLNNIQLALDQAATDLAKTDVLILTFGTAYVFKHKESGQVVANCHKQPAAIFDRQCLSIDEIVTEWDRLILQLKVLYPNLKIMLTVSPIRHWKDGAHGNQLSKSILLLAIDALQKIHANLFYFPAYELVLDDLRDYRFYEEDMIHPNKVAVNYIWECFSQLYFDENTKSAINEWEYIQRALNHRPFNKDSEDHQQFLQQTREKLLAHNRKWKK